MTRILALTLYYPPHHYGGYELSCRDVMTRLGGRGHEVAVVTTDLRLPEVDEPDDPSVPVDRRLTGWVRDNALYRPPFRQRWRHERDNHQFLRGALDRFRPEVVTVWHMGAMSLGLMHQLVDAGLPLVYVIGDDWLVYAPELDSWTRMFRRAGPAARALAPLLKVRTTVPDLGPTGAFLFNSDDNRRRAEEASPWQLARQAVVYSGFDGQVFTPGSAPRSPWRGRLLFAGRYDARKGLATVVRALADLPGHSLEVRGTGDAPEREHLKELAASHGVTDRVHFEEPLPSAALAERYRQADAVVFPSEWDEPFGLVPVEAMSCGTPVIGTGTGGSGEFLLDDVNSLRFAAGDPAALAAAVRRLGGDAELRARLVAAGRHTAAFFDVEHLTDAVEDWVAAAARGFAGTLPASRRFTAAVALAEPDQAGPSYRRSQ